MNQASRSLVRPRVALPLGATLGLSALIAATKVNTPDEDKINKKNCRNGTVRQESRIHFWNPVVSAASPFTTLCMSSPSLRVDDSARSSPPPIVAAIPPATKDPVKLRISREPRLANKVAIITGAGRGLGQAIAIKFVQEGAKVVLLDLDPSSSSTLQHIERIHFTDDEGGGETISADDVALFVKCDISDPKQVDKAISKAVQRFGPKIDILVNNACRFVFQSVETASVEDWENSMRVNILGHALVTKACLPYMKHAMKDNNTDDDKSIRKGYGPSIIFQGSISSFLAQPNCATYATMKGAIVQLARNCAYDFAKYNIRVNSVCPGTIETPISQRERDEHGWTYEEWEKMKVPDVMLQRVGFPDEIASAIVFFASEESSYCTGTHLMVDGGQSPCTIMEE